VLMQQKGGASKSSLCIHLAVASEQAGYKTAVIDTDPQGSASAVWGAARGDVAPPVAAVIAAELKDALDAAEADGYRVIFIDTPPHTAPAIERVIKFVDLAIVPVQPSILDVAATQNTVDLLRAAKVPTTAILNPGCKRHFVPCLGLVAGHRFAKRGGVFPVQGGRMSASAIARSKCAQFWNTTYMVMVRKCSKNR
jgi:cellulose biosynthesis protein BcsQ